MKSGRGSSRRRRKYWTMVGFTHCLDDACAPTGGGRGGVLVGTRSAISSPNPLGPLRYQQHQLPSWTVSCQASLSIINVRIYYYSARGCTSWSYHQTVVSTCIYDPLSYSSKVNHTSHHLSTTIYTHMAPWAEEYSVALAVRDRREKANSTIYDACT